MCFCFLFIQGDQGAVGPVGPAVSQESSHSLMLAVT